MDPGELLFERYLAEHGYEIMAYEPQLGTRKKPDYFIRATGHEVVVEVESFNPPPLAASFSPGSFVRGPNLTSVRRKITSGAGQLKGICKYPLVIVLANPRLSPVPLAPDHIMQAMYGDLQFAFVEEGGHQWRTGRNGRLHVDEPDGSKRGNHPYLSAVAVIRCARTADAWVAAWLRQHEADYSNPVAAYAEAVKLAEGEGVHGETVSLDVFETVSETACPLPRTFFNGPYDMRWGVISLGRYGRIGLTGLYSGTAGRSHHPQGDSPV